MNNDEFHWIPYSGASLSIPDWRDKDFGASPDQEGRKR